MGKDIAPDIEKEITSLLKNEGKNYLTVTQIRGGLSIASLKHLGLTKKSPPTNVLKKLRAQLGNSLQVYRGPRYTYIGFKVSPEEMIRNKIRQKPGLSSKMLGKDLPLINRDFIPALNALLEAGIIVCTFKEKNHIPSLKIAKRAIIPEITDQFKEEPVDDRAAFKVAYDEVGKGRSFIRIHRIREYLNWSRERFDQVLMGLRDDYTIQLHGGDPSVMSEAEIKDSFIDENGMLYVTLTWRGKK
jgi:hypothetical protein